MAKALSNVKGCGGEQGRIRDMRSYRELVRNISLGTAHPVSPHGPSQGQHTARLLFPFPTSARRPSWGPLYLLLLLVFGHSSVGSRLPSGFSHIAETWLDGREALPS